MKSFSKWLLSIVGKAAVILIVIAVFPYMQKVSARLFPSLSGDVQIQSTVLMNDLRSSARLETLIVDEEGVLVSETNVILLGTVGKTVISYRYEGSFGIDLKKVQIQLKGNDLTFLIPPLEVLNDRITPLEINKNDFLSHAIDKQPEELLNEQRLKCQKKYLDDSRTSEEIIQKTKNAFEETIGEWMNTYGKQHYVIHFGTID